MIYTTQYISPMGTIMLASDGDNLIGLWLEGQKCFSESVKEEIKESADLPVFQAAAKWLDAYFSGARPQLQELPLAPRGGEFRQTVWELLCEIPYGELTTYGEIAVKIAARLNKTRMSAQAVGGAVGHNPISIIIPCHRVVGANGSMTGYAGGIEKKIKLLKHEGVDMYRLYVPAKGTAL